MILQILNRFRRSPISAVSIILLAAVLASSLCALHASNLAEQARYDKILETTKVQLIVTNLTATRYDGLEAPGWVDDVFADKWIVNNLVGYVTDIRRLGRQELDSLQIDGANYHSDAVLFGADSLEMIRHFSSGNSPVWLDGYDDSLFSTNDLVCIIPEDMMPEYLGDTPVTLHMEFSYHYPAATAIGPGEPIQPTDYYTNRDFRVVGTHNNGDDIYCPYQVVAGIYHDLYKTSELDGIRATLEDNSTIETVREISKAWFAEPNPTGEKTPWDYTYYFYYPYALLIDDSKLVDAERTLKISILINELCAVLVFVLSAGASFFVGFLMIRSRKREISLMRTLGTRPTAIFFSFALEQLICLLFGIALGGLVFGFRPMERLAAFAAVYFAGLCAALILFLRNNLMNTLKEDD